jgi:hypothetical protein
VAERVAGCVKAVKAPRSGGFNERTGAGTVVAVCRIGVNDHSIGVNDHTEQLVSDRAGGENEESELGPIGLKIQTLAIISSVLAVIAVVIEKELWLVQ